MRPLITIDPKEVNSEVLFTLLERLYPICRSITGEGVRETLHLLQDVIALNMFEIPSGTPVFDWTVPREWNIKDAYVKSSTGEKIIDFKKHNLHVLNYSIPVHKKVGLQELKQHCHTLPDHPNWIPYKTSYYNDAWGFCLAHEQLNALPEDEYEVFIDSTLESGFLTYGEYFIQGEINEEVLIYTHTCHPSLCNDNLSGLTVVSHLAKILRKYSLKYSYRFVFGPGTIGSITWLSRNEQRLPNIKHALVVALVGDRGPFTYKKSRQGDVLIDQIMQTVLTGGDKPFEIIDFSPYGYDERQFCSPGINLNAGRLTRTPNSCYEQYHSSADDLQFVSAVSLFESLQVCLEAINVLEANETYINLNPKCEPQLGKRGLFSKAGGHKKVANHDFAVLWVLNLSDGQHSLLDIARRSKLSFTEIYYAAKDLCEANLLAVAV